MNETEQFEPQLAALKARSLIEFSEADDFAADPEENLRNEIETMLPDVAAKVLIRKLPVGDNLRDQFVNPCTIEKRGISFDLTPGDTLENVYQWIAKHHEGGKYFLQFRQGQRSGRACTVVLADLPVIKPRAAAQPDDDEPKRIESIAQTAPKAESPAKIAKQAMQDNLAFMRELKEVFGEVYGIPEPGAQSVAQAPTREETLLNIAKSTDDPEIKRRCLNGILGDENATPEKKSLADAAIELLFDPQRLEGATKAVVSAASPYVMPYIAHLFGASQQPPTAAAAQSVASEQFAPRANALTNPLDLLKQPAPTRNAQPESEAGLDD